MTLTGNWSYPTAIKFGAGRIKELADACKSAGISRPLLVTDKDGRLALIPRSIRTRTRRTSPPVSRSTAQAAMTA